MDLETFLVGFVDFLSLYFRSGTRSLLIFGWGDGAGKGTGVDGRKGYFLWNVRAVVCDQHIRLMASRLFS